MSWKPIGQYAGAMIPSNRCMNEENSFVESPPRALVSEIGSRPWTWNSTWSQTWAGAKKDRIAPRKENMVFKCAMQSSRRRLSVSVCN